MATRLPSVRLPHGQQLFFLLTCPIFHSLHQHSHYFLHIWRLHQLCTMDLNRRVFLPPCFPRFPVRSSLFIRWNSDFQVEPFACRASPRHSSTDFRSKSSVNKGQRSTIIRLGFSAYSSVYFKTFQTSIDFWFFTFLASSCFTQFHGNFYEFLASAVNIFTFSPQVLLLQRRMPSFFQIQQAPPPQNQVAKLRFCKNSPNK